jgi:signal transduction histidine kinase
MQAAGRDATSTPLEFLREAYGRLLQASTESGGEPARAQAYALGRFAIDQRLGILDTVLIHHAILDARWPDGAPEAERSRRLTAAAELLVEFLSPFDMAYQGFLDANSALRSVNETLEGEARRIARLLHDSAGQLLFALQLAHANLARDVPADLAERFTEMGRVMHQLDEQLHSTSDELYPVVLEDLGLEPALHELLDTVARRTSLVTALEGSGGGRPPSDVESAIYRAAHEAVSNVVKHAHASRLTVSLERVNATLRCTVADDGLGIREPPVPRHRQGLGLVGIHERLRAVRGTARVTSTPGGGTSVVLEVPLDGG